MMFGDELKKILTPSLCASDEVYRQAIARFQQGNFTKDENPLSHFCTHFVAFDAKDDTALLVDHKRAKTWIFTGGHVDRGEVLLQTLNREINEELGIQNFYVIRPEPFLLTRKDIINDDRPCKEHFDIWFRMEVPKEKVHIDMDEFHGARWLSYEDAQALLTDANNLAALRLLFAKS